MKKIIILISIIACTLNVFCQTQTDMNIASSAEYKAADKELNLVFGKLMKKLDEKEKTELIEAEKAWIKFRDLHCKFACLQYVGGSMYSTIYASEMTTLTNQRVEQLKILLENYSR